MSNPTLVEGMLAAALGPTESVMSRRPDLDIINRDIVASMYEATKRAGGELFVPLPKVVALLGLPKTYDNPDTTKALLLAGALQRRFERLGYRTLRVGSVKKGAIIRFRVE